LLPYRNQINSPKVLLEEWLSEFRSGKPVYDDEETVDGEPSNGVGPCRDGLAELPRLLRLLASFDALFDDPEAGTKFNALFELVDEIREPIVVFSQAVDTVYELEARLQARGCELYRLTGDMSVDARLAAIQAFRTSNEPKRLLLSSAAGGIGINLQVARVVVHFDLPWNPMVLEQRVGRVHRIGSSRTILVETILLRGSREAEVFDRITQRLQEIVLDLSNDPAEREALFRRILASLEPDLLRELFSGEETLDAVGAAVEAGRRAVNEVDDYMLELKAQTTERHGRATMERLIQFLKLAEGDLTVVGSRLYAVLTEVDGGELRQVQRTADVYSFGLEDECIVFDRTASSYLGLRRDQTGGLGHALVDPLIRSAIDLTSEHKPRSSTWVAPVDAVPAWLRPGDVIYFALDASNGTGSFTDARLRSWRIRQHEAMELSEVALEEFLWDTLFTGSRKAGDFPNSGDALPQELIAAAAGVVRFPIAAIGIRERIDR
jgi:nucleotide-binding universal stress UspA family protein